MHNSSFEQTKARRSQVQSPPQVHSERAYPEMKTKQNKNEKIWLNELKRMQPPPPRSFVSIQEHLNKNLDSQARWPCSLLWQSQFLIVGQQSLGALKSLASLIASVSSLFNDHSPDLHCGCFLIHDEGPAGDMSSGWCSLMGTGWRMNKEIDRKIIVERVASFQENDIET